MDSRDIIGKQAILTAEGREHFETNDLGGIVYRLDKHPGFFAPSKYAPAPDKFSIDINGYNTGYFMCKEYLKYFVFKRKPTVIINV